MHLNLFRQLKVRQAEFPRGLVLDLLESFPVFLAWKRVRHPTHALRNAMEKQACTVWKVKRRINKIRRSAGDIAEDLEELLVLNATELLNGSVAKHAHWLTLLQCAEWVQQQCQGAPSELENEALTTVLSGIRSWLEMRRYSDHELRKNLRATAEGDKRRDIWKHNAAHKRASV